MWSGRALRSGVACSQFSSRSGCRCAPLPRTWPARTHEALAQNSVSRPAPRVTLGHREAAGPVAATTARSVGLLCALVGDMPVHPVVPVQGIGGALTVLEASVLPTLVGERTPVCKPRVAVIAGQHL